MTLYFCAVSVSISHFYDKDLVSRITADPSSLLMKLSDMCRKYRYILFNRSQFLFAIPIPSHRKMSLLQSHVFFVSLHKREIEQKSRVAPWENQASEVMPVTIRREGRELKINIFSNCYFTIPCEYIQ